MKLGVSGWIWGLLVAGGLSGSLLAADPEGCSGGDSPFRWFKLPQDAQVGASASQFLGALDRTAPLRPWRPQTNEEKWKGSLAEVYSHIAPAVVVIRAGDAHGTGFVIARPAGS